MENRRVTFTAYLDSAQAIKFVNGNPITGIFKKWGDDIYYVDNECFARTVGIVLGEDLKVYAAIPNSMTVL